MAVSSLNLTSDEPTPEPKNGNRVRLNMLWMVLVAAVGFLGNNYMSGIEQMKKDAVTLRSDVSDLRTALAEQRAQNAEVLRRLESIETKLERRR